MEHDTPETKVTLDAVKAEAQKTAHQVATSRMDESKRRIDWDVRGIIAVAAVIFSFGLAITQLTLRGDANIPTWAATMVGAVIGFYFGGRSTGTNGYGRRKED